MLTHCPWFQALHGRVDKTAHDLARSIEALSAKHSSLEHSVLEALGRRSANLTAKVVDSSTALEQRLTVWQEAHHERTRQAGLRGSVTLT